MSGDAGEAGASKGVLVMDTRLDVESSSFRWNVHDFDRVCVAPRPAQEKEAHIQEVRCLLDVDFLQSPPFRVGESGLLQTTWHLYLQKENPSSEYLSVFLYLISAGMPDFSPLIKYSFSILNPRGTVLHQKADSTMVRLELDSSWGESKFISLASLLAEKDKLLSGNTLRLLVELEIIHDFTHQIRQRESGTITPGFKLESVPNFCPAKTLLQELWNTRAHYDMLISCGNSTYPVHKCVLSGASPVFEAMLRTDMNERATNTVKIDDIEDRIVGKMLRFVYTDEIEATDWKDLDLVKDLLHAADKYQLDRFKLQCFNELCDTFLKLDKVSELVVLIHLYGASDGVKEEIFNYFQEKRTTIQSLPSFNKACEECPAAFIALLRKSF